jgi:AcrR family transcriptional regulator
MADTIASMPLDDQTTRELSRASKQVTSWTERRNALIKAAHAAGGGVREIARATGLNVGTVHNILFGRRRGGTSE